MKRIWVRTLIVLWVVWSPGSQVLATSGSPVKALDGIKAVGVEIVLGGGLSLSPHSDLGLFAGDAARAKSLHAELMEAASVVLDEGGIRAYPAPAGIRDDSWPVLEPVPGETGWIMFSFYGRPSGLSGSGGALYVLLTVVDVWHDRPPSECDCDEATLRRLILGVASESSLEQEMRKTLLAVLESFVAEARN